MERRERTKAGAALPDVSEMAGGGEESSPTYLGETPVKCRVLGYQQVLAARSGVTTASGGGTHLNPNDRRYQEKRPVEEYTLNPMIGDIKKRPKPRHSLSGGVLFYPFTGVNMPSIKDFEFKGEGKGIRHGQAPICVKFPQEIDAVLRQMPNRSDFIREAVAEKLAKNGTIPPNPLPATD